MADDDTPEVDDLDVEEVFDIVEADEIGEEFEADESVEALAESESEDEDDDIESPVRAAKAKADDDDDDEEDDEIEADLGDILKDRIAAGDDDDEDDEDDLPKAPKPSADIAPKRADEWTCEQCFFIVSKNQFGTKAEPRCPQGEEPCPSIARAFS